MESKQEDILHFLKTGHLKHINFGMFEKEVVSILGPSEGKIVKSTKNDLEKLKYGHWEFHFLVCTMEPELYGILYFPSNNAVPTSKWFINEHNWNSDLELSDALEILGRNKIKFSAIESSDSEETIIKTNSNITLYFLKNSKNENPKFYNLCKYVDV